MPLQKPSFYLCVFLILFSLAFAGVKKNDLIFREDFEDAAITGRNWSLGTSLSKDEKKQDKAISTGQGKAGNGFVLEKTESNGNVYLKKVFTPEELAKMKGAIVFLSASLRAENVSGKKYSYSGVKLQCSFWTKGVKPGTLEASIGDLRPGVYFPDGSFDWTNRGFVLSIPDEVEAGLLAIGLEGCSGKVWYDNVEIKVIESLAVDDSWRPAPYTPHSLPRLRGEMIFDKITDADLQHLGENWKANMIRWNIGSWDRNIFKNGLESEGFDALFAKEMERTDGIVASGKKYGMLVVLDMMGVSQHGLFKNVASQNRFVECWKILASRYRTNAGVWGYDLSNE
ncbi:MAG: cellulase family glycosylhydrolase, partial [Spirochaetia bacterium]|nr:cellulase family glycosylhydrolase [Spirochaetia bacterium]